MIFKMIKNYSNDLKIVKMIQISKKWFKNDKKMVKWF